MGVPFWTLRGTIDLTSLRPQDLTAGAIADALAKINRFNGRTAMPWSVAAHSVLVERLCTPDLGPWALLHDAHEVFLGDFATPVVELISAEPEAQGFDKALSRIKGRIDRAVSTTWNTPVRSMNQALRAADHIALKAEAAVFLGVRHGPLKPDEADALDRAVGLILEHPEAGDWRVARDLWLGRVAHYQSLGRMSPPKDATAPTGA